ncbi:pentalenic acid synthase [Allocatelliglobosispora scoriae]|uniref:Pentalenic acid synthase n=1 Tax=Allocatelliglobosispora scoriae TaxID=643052 RepID=A0A841BTE1_9ACTN|nr:cytochrome P450 [Allocatelliglobosispora scoriae]MBB5870061.1 pentalenic acid synthase [Allocatelliglobosispora scoriae]
MTEELMDYPLARECYYRPSARTAQLREAGPISRVRLYDGRSTWMVTGPAEARALLADPRVSNRSDFPDYPVMDPKLLQMRATREMAREVEEGGFAGALFGIDPPEHTRQRQMLVPKFTVRRVAVLRPELESIVDEQLDVLLAQGSPGDLVSAFSAPVPMRAVCAYLGVPYAEREEFEPIVRQLFDPAMADVAVERLNAYLGKLVISKEQNPGSGGLIDDLIAKHVTAGELDHTELIAFAQAILVAGTVTTSSLLALGTIALLDNPGQYATLVEDPDLIPGAVEEILRYVSLVEQLARVATEDIEIAGEVIKAGDGMLISFAGANLDPSVTTHPQELDVTRPPTHHLAFSHGIHHCLGRNLARLELEIAFRGLVTRFPTLRLAMPASQIPTYVDGDVQRVACLPVSW